MAIDLLTRGLECPIFVGDTASLGRFKHVANSGDLDELMVYLVDEEGVGTAFPISRAAKDSLMRNDVAVLVSIAPNDEIERAFVCSIDDADTPNRMMDEAEVKFVAEELVKGDFNLDLIQSDGVA